MYADHHKRRASFPCHTDVAKASMILAAHTRIAHSFSMHGLAIHGVATFPVCIRCQVLFRAKCHIEKAMLARSDEVPHLKCLLVSFAFVCGSHSEDWRMSAISGDVS
jgi:hypothetical protein